MEHHGSDVTSRTTPEPQKQSVTREIAFVAIPEPASKWGTVAENDSYAGGFVGTTLFELAETRLHRIVRSNTQYRLTRFGFVE
jgi:hypothetical protein